MSNRDVAIRFLERFSAGDVDGLVPLLAEDLRFEGPLHRFATRHDYLSCLRDDPPSPCECRVLSLTEKEDQVAVFYEYQKPDGAVTVAQLFCFEEGLIARTVLVFDGRGVA